MLIRDCCLSNLLQTYSSSNLNACFFWRSKNQPYKDETSKSTTKCTILCKTHIAQNCTTLAKAFATQNPIKGRRSFLCCFHTFLCVLKGRTHFRRDWDICAWVLAPNALFTLCDTLICFQPYLFCQTGQMFYLIITFILKVFLIQGSFGPKTFASHSGTASLIQCMWDRNFVVTILIMGLFQHGHIDRFDF